jgi:hypothetical protein
MNSEAGIPSDRREQFAIERDIDSPARKENAMKTRTFRAAVCLSLLLSGSLGAHAQTPKTPSAPVAAVTAAQANLRLVQAEYRAGVDTTADVNEATASLALAQIRAALAQEATESIPADLATPQDQRREQLKLTMTRFQAGVADTSEVIQAQGGLAEAQVSVALFTLWTVRHQALLQTQAMMRVGLVPNSEVDKAAAAAQAVLTQFTDSLPQASAPASKP